MTQLARVLVVTNIPTPYRLPLFRELAKQLAACGLSLKVVFGAAGYGRRQWQVDLDSCGFDHEVLSNRSFTLSGGEFPSFSYPGLSALIARERPAAVVVVGYSPATVKVWLRSWLHRVPYVIWSGTVPDSPDHDSVLRVAQRRLLVARAAATVAYGSKAREYLLSLGAAPNRCFIAINTVDTEFFSRETALLRVGETNPEVLWVGDLTERKGVDLLLRTFSVVARDRPGVVLTLVGDGPEKGNLSALAKSLGIDVSVRFEGYRQRAELPAYMARARCFAFPTRFDIWGLVLPEAMAAGLPCVASTTAGATPDLIEDGITGFQADFSDTATAAEKIGWLLDHPVEARRIGVAASDFALERANLRVSAAGLVAAVDAATGGRRS